MTLPLKLAFAEIRKLEGERGKDLWLWYCPEGASGEPLLLLAKKPIAVSEINEARKGAKSKQSCKGRIGLDDKTLKVRVVGTAPSNLLKALRKLSADNGLRVANVELLENQPDNEDDSLEQASSGSAGGADDDGNTAVTRDDLTAALLRAKPQIDQVKAHAQKRLQLADIMSDINDKAERGRYGEAVKRVGDVVALAAVSDAKLGEHRKKVADGAIVSATQIKGWKDEEKQWRDAARLDTYQVGKKVGAGGMGAINLMNSTDAGAPPLVLKTGGGLDHEADIYAKVGPHPNIVRSLGMQKVGDRSGLVLEAVTGGDMSKALEDMSKMREAGTLKEEEFWGVLQFSMRRSLEALAFMQQQGVTHRDIKPANIMYDEATGEPKLVDMGIATEDDKAAKGFTHGYVPAHSKETADKNDPFAVGASLFEVAQGNTGSASGAGKGFKYGKEQVSPGWKATLDISDYHADDKNRAMKVSDKPGEVFTTDADGKQTKKEGMYGASTAYTEFVNWLMHPDPAQRPDPATALAHPFLQQAMLGDDEARASVKKIIQARKAPDAGTTAPGLSAQQARTQLAQVIRSDLPKQIEAASKRAEQATKLAAALQAKVDKSGKKVTVQAEELGRYEALVAEFKSTADKLRTERAAWADAGQALTTATASAANDPTQAKQLASDQKLLQAVTATTRKAQDALTALEQATLAVNRALGKADEVAQDAWAATDLGLSAKTWAAMKKGAIQHGLKDEATGVGSAFEVCDKLSAEFAKKKQAKVHAGLLLALGKLRGKVAAMKPVTSWGGPHPGMVAYRDALVQAIDAEVLRVQNDKPAG
ncbi:MAG TPA: protein kinase [Ideonella sp.]|nr:protein kinase [Ideonella sp.]